MSAKTEKERSWQEYQDEIADDTGLAVVLIDGEGLSFVAESNNNSVCKALSISEKFAPSCEKYCGRAFSEATEAAKPLKFKCHAGLECVAVPVRSDNNKQFVAITGRAFVKSDDYRKATEKAISGVWKDFPPTKFFENVLLTGSRQNIESAARKFTEMSDGARRALSLIGSRAKDIQSDEKEIPQNKNSETDNRTTEKPAAKRLQDINVEAVLKNKAKAVSKTSTDDKPKTVDKTRSFSLSIQSEKTPEKPAQRSPKIKATSAGRSAAKSDNAAQRKFLDSIRDKGYRDACLSVLVFLKEHYSVSSSAWLENRSGRLTRKYVAGSLRQQKIKISLKTDDEQLLEIFRKGSSIELQERNGKDGTTQKMRLFPIAVADEIRWAITIGERSGDAILGRRIAQFCQMIAPELEILRLREELTRRSWLDVALQNFSESLRMIDKDDFWIRLMQHTARLMQAERGSILVYDEAAKKLVVKAMIGRKADIIKQSKAKIGERVAENVWKTGKALVVPSISKTSVQPAPSEWKYKTESFISYPISIGDRRIGVLNVADKTDGGSYQEFDLQLLRSIVPQIAVAIDHATLKNKAGKFEQLSVTDSLTGLLNRRYLEERLTEEIKRSNRHGYSMSFLMIDVDNFKSYNDTFSHPEGDKALHLVAQCLKDSLRGADVASRYGGEEFSILLPQTSLEEAETIAERIREKISSTDFPNRQVTVSVGITSLYSSDNTAEDIISAADHALFDAKRNGRDNVQVYKELRKELQLQN